MSDLGNYRTMNEEYGDGSLHEFCGECGFCRDCEDCTVYGCGSERTEDKVQDVIESLVQWDAFLKVWGKSTPRQKWYVRDVLAKALAKK